MLPGWNSLETVTRLHSFFEVAGIVSLGALVVMEIGALVYGHRKERLVAQASEQSIRDLQAKTAARQLTAKQKNQLVTALAAHKGDHVTLANVLGDAEGKHFAGALAAALAEGGWTIDQQKDSMYDVDPIGLVVAVKDANAAPWAAVHLMDALTAAGLPAEYAANGSIAAAVVELRVGRKPDL